MYKLAFFTLLLNAAHCYGLNCNQTANASNYKSFPSVYNGEVVINSTVDGCDLNRDMPLEFQCDYSVVLGDGVMVPSPPDLTNSSYVRHFLAWQRGAAQSYVDFDLSVLEITAIELSFLNNPDNGIGLPDIQLSLVIDYRESAVEDVTLPLQGTLVDNQDLSQMDMQIRSVTLLANIGPLFTNLRIGFQFTEFHDFDWFLLSEVRFCTDPKPTFPPSVITFHPLPSIIVEPTADDLMRGSIELECTVSSEGEYQWQWERANSVIETTDPDYAITIGEGTRTTKLMLSNLDFSDAGQYGCRAMATDAAATSSSIVQFVQFPETVTTPNVVNKSLETGEVTLSCELHGYQSSLSSPVWLFMNGTEITTSDKYNITPGQGSNTIVLENGTVLPSEIVNLRISALTSADEGSYTCRGARGESMTQIRVVEGTVPPTTSIPLSTALPTSSPSPCPLEDTCTAYIIPVVIIIVMAIAIVGLLIIVALLVIKLKKSSTAARLTSKNRNSMLRNTFYNSHSPGSPHNYEMIPETHVNMNTSFPGADVHTRKWRSLSMPTPIKAEEFEQPVEATTDIDGGNVSYLTATPADYEEPLTHSYERLTSRANSMPLSQDDDINYPIAELMSGVVLRNRNIESAAYDILHRPRAATSSPIQRRSDQPYDHLQMPRATSSHVIDSKHSEVDKMIEQLSAEQQQAPDTRNSNEEIEQLENTIEGSKNPDTSKGT